MGFGHRGPDGGVVVDNSLLQGGIVSVYYLGTLGKVPHSAKDCSFLTRAIVIIPSTMAQANGDSQLEPSLEAPLEIGSAVSNPSFSVPWLQSLAPHCNAPPRITTG